MKLETIKELIAEINEIRNYLQLDYDIDNIDELMKYYMKVYRPHESEEYIH